MGEVQARGGEGGAERGGAGRGWVGQGGVVTYFADRIGAVLQILPLSPGIRVCVSLSGKHFCSCALLLHSPHREVHSENVFTPNMQKKCSNTHANGSSGA